jgi:YesN/AraC family two-component response regulator
LVNRRTQVPDSWKVAPALTNTHIILLVTEGSVTYQFHDEYVQLQARELMFIPYQTFRSALPCPPNYHKMYSAHFMLDSGGLELPFLQKGERKKVTIHQFEYLKQRFSLLSELWKDRVPHYELHCQAVLLEILVLANREMELGQYTPKKLQLVEQLKAYIQSHYHKPISLSDMAAHTNRSPNYICNVFKEMLGQSPVDYLNQIRIAAARELLLNTEQPISEIALMVGFSDPYYFSKVYKKVTGMTPKMSLSE